MAPVVSRVSRKCEFVGHPCDFDGRTLPTVGDVVRCLLHVRYERMEAQKSLKQPSMTDIAHTVAEKIQYIWIKASVPPMAAKSIQDKIKKLNESYLAVKAYPVARRSSAPFLKVKGTFLSKANTLFEVAACPCDLSIPRNCNCLPENKIPARECAFITDQRGPRQMVISTVDNVVTKMQGRKQDRLLKQEIYAQKVAQSQTQHHSADETLNKNDTEEFLSDLSENDTEFTLKTRSGQSKQMRERLPTVAKMADRFALSDAATAAIATATLRDLEIIRKDNMAKAIDPFKIRRERKKARVETLELQRSLEGSLQGLYFDGKRNVTLQSGKKKVVEEHISLVSEPGSKYIGHVTPSGGLAIDLADSILQFLEANNYDLTQLKVVGADGTAHNTGHIGGAITLLENRLGKSLQWQICLLHFNELPLRHLILHLDGTTSGPNSFTGPIGKQLKTCEEKPIVT